MDTEKQRLEERLLHLLQYEQGRYLNDLVQHFAYRGSSHRREGAARLKNVYGLDISLVYSSGDEGGIFLVQLFLYAFAALGGREGGQHPVVAVHNEIYIFFLKGA